MYSLSPEYSLVKERAAATARTISQWIDEMDRNTGHTPLWWKAIHLMEEAGLLSLGIPKEEGGKGADLFSLVLAQEEMGKVDGGLANIISHEACAYRMVNVSKHADVRQHFVQKMVNGSLTCIGITEPEVGSDLAKMHSRAQRVSDGYVLNGQKRVASLAAAADLFIVFAMTDPEKGVRGISAFVIDKETPGLSVGEVDELMGFRQLPPADVFLDDVKVGKDQLLGEEGDGLRIFADALNVGRLGGGTQALGIAQGALDLTVAYAKERHTFGKPLIEHQAIQFSLADMATAIEVSRAFVYRVAQWMDIHPDISAREVGKYCAMVKSSVSDTAMKVTTDAIQVFGAYGNYRRYGIERYFREAKVTQLVDGPNELMKMRVGHSLIRGY